MLPLFSDWAKAHRSHLPQLIMQINNLNYQLRSTISALWRQMYLGSMVKAWRWWSSEAKSLGQDHSHRKAAVEATITNLFTVTLDIIMQGYNNLHSLLVLVLISDQWQLLVQGPLRSQSVQVTITGSSTQSSKLPRLFIVHLDCKQERSHYLTLCYITMKHCCLQSHSFIHQIITEQLLTVCSRHMLESRNTQWSTRQSSCLRCHNLVRGRNREAITIWAKIHLRETTEKKITRQWRMAS